MEQQKEEEKEITGSPEIEEKKSTLKNLIPIIAHYPFTLTGFFILIILIIIIAYYLIHKSKKLIGYKNNKIQYTHQKTRHEDKLKTLQTMKTIYHKEKIIKYN